MQFKAVLHFRVGWAGDHLNMMSQVVKGMGQVAYVNPLAAAMGMTPIAQQGNAEGAMLGCWIQ